MNNMNHPDIEQLNAYMQDPMGNEYRQLRLHLASCLDCREQLGLLTDLKVHLPGIEAELYQQNVSRDDALSEALQTQLIEKYVDGQLDKPAQQRVAGILRDNGQALKAALHYASHSARMQRDAGNDAETISIASVNARHEQPPRPEGQPSLRRWLALRLPVWLTVPVTAVAASLLSILLIPQLELASTKPALIAYQDNPVIQFKRAQSLPGLGFFSDANKIIKPYDSINASLVSKNDIQLSWPSVENAISYTMHLKVFTRGQQLSVGKITTTTTQASFTRVVNDSGQRYVWRLSGKTANGKLFSTKGGFVINDGKE